MRLFPTLVLLALISVSACTTTKEIVVTATPTATEKSPPASAPPAAAAPAATTHPTAVPTPTPPLPTATPRPAAAATPTPEPPPPMIPRLPNSVNQFVTPTPTVRRLAVVPPRGLDLHGLDLMRIGSEIKKTSSPSTSLTYETVKLGEAVTLIITSNLHGVVHSAKILWSSEEMPWDELNFLGAHVDPDGWTGCVLDAAFVAHRRGQPGRTLPLTARGNWLYATAATEEDGSYSLTYTSWEFMPAFKPDTLPVECE